MMKVSAGSASSALAVPSPKVQLAWLSLAMFLGMTMWFSATAANAPIVAEFHLTSAETAWLTMAVQGGFVIGTLLSAILNLPDIINPRRLFAIGCVLGAAANAALVGAGPYVAVSARFDPGAVARVFADRRTRLATLGYLGHMWELYAVWTWIAAFASASFAGSGAPGSATPSSPAGSAVAFATIASGAIGSAAAGSVADRIGKARIAAWAMLVSGTGCGIAGFLYHAPAPVLWLFAVVWGVA